MSTRPWGSERPEHDRSCGHDQEQRRVDTKGDQPHRVRRVRSAHAGAGGAELTFLVKLCSPARDRRPVLRHHVLGLGQLRLVGNEIVPFGATGRESSALVSTVPFFTMLASSIGRAEPCSQRF